MDGGGWLATVHGVAKNQTGLSNVTFTSVDDTGKTIALTVQTFVGKVTSLLFTMLSRLVIAFLPKNTQD